MKKSLLFILFSTLTACSIQANQIKEKEMLSHQDYIKDLDIQCVYEKLPTVSSESEVLYQYARYQDLHNMWKGKKGDAIWQSTLPYYRIASANGNYKANIRLQYLLETGRIVVKNPIDEVLSLNKELEKQLPATAYYKLYQHLANGYGVKVKEKLGRFAFLRKAAEMGSREAQYELGDLIVSIKDPNSFEFRKALRKKLLTCASEQGLGEASKMLGIRLKNEKLFSDSIKVYQQGIKNGNALSARALRDGFSGEERQDSDDYLGLSKDSERSTRYKMIARFLADYDYLHPTVPDLDDIVPLPPAKLPAWDGKIAFQRWYEGPSPAKPSDELMQKLAEKAGLDWQTGLPLKK